MNIGKNSKKKTNDIQYRVHNRSAHIFFIVFNCELSIDFHYFAEPHW